MKYTHAIIYKGKYYRAGEDVPVEAKPTEANNTSETDKDTETTKKRGKTKA